MSIEELTGFLDSRQTDGISYKRDLLLSNYSSFKIGGKADVGIFPKTKEAFCEAINFLENRKMKYTVIGKGSNVLFADEGYRGAIVFTEGLCEIKTGIDTVYAECGASLFSLSSKILSASLSGFEFAYGIPGSVGGAVYMNAGAYGKSISDVLQSAEVYDCRNGRILSLDSEQMDFAYRHSICMDENYTVLSATFKLNKGNSEEIKTAMDEIYARRKDKQPLEYPSAGSVFKRPEGYFAGKLIEDSRLKGFSIGGAQVSEKHAGFIVNKGGASAKDVLSLIKHIRYTVLNNFGVLLECEIRYID